MGDETAFQAHFGQCITFKIVVLNKHLQMTSTLTQDVHVSRNNLTSDLDLLEHCFC